MQNMGVVPVIAEEPGLKDVPLVNDTFYDEEWWTRVGNDHELWNLGSQVTVNQETQPEPHQMSEAQPEPVGTSEVEPEAVEMSETKPDACEKSEADPEPELKKLKRSTKPKLTIKRRSERVKNLVSSKGPKTTTFINLTDSDDDMPTKEPQNADHGGVDVAPSPTPQSQVLDEAPTSLHAGIMQPLPPQMPKGQFWTKGRLYTTINALVQANAAKHKQQMELQKQKKIKFCNFYGSFILMF